jgi:nucleotide-binding universal stress UspA family protein
MVQPMITSILVPLDGSPFAEHAIATAVSIARRGRALINLVHVDQGPVHGGWGPTVDPELENHIRATRRRALQTLADQLVADTALRITLTMVTGPVAETLEEHIAATRPDFVVMSTHGATGIKRAILGSVAGHIIAHSAAPVLLVRPASVDPEIGSTKVFHHILVALDGSALAEQVIDRTLPLAVPGETRFTLLEIVVLTSLTAMSYPANAVPMEFAGSVDERREELRPHLNDVAAGLRARGFDTSVQVVSHWQAATGILEQADVGDADLIALSTRGHGGLRRLVLGSVADGVVHGAETPVLVFHPVDVDNDAPALSAEAALLGATE